MVTLQQLRAFVVEKKQQHPALADEIEDLFQLAVAEIESGESMMHEIDLCVESINQLIGS
jgi:hypothetical protein